MRKVTLRSSVILLCLGAISLICGKGEAEAAEFDFSYQFQVNDRTTLDQDDPRIAPLGNGGFVVVWEHDQPTEYEDIAAKIFNAAGAQVTSEFTVNTFQNLEQSDPIVATSLVDGSFIVVYENRQFGIRNDSLNGQIFSQNGQRIGEEFQIAECDLNNFSFVDPKVAAFSDGGFVVVFLSEGAIWAQIYDESFQVLGDLGSNQATLLRIPMVDRELLQPDVAVLEDDSFVVVWVDREDGDLNPFPFGGEFFAGLVAGQKFNRNGSEIGDMFYVDLNATDVTVEIEKWDPSVAAMDDGFVVAWREEDYFGNDEDAIMVQTFYSVGNETESSSDGIVVSENLGTYAGKPHVIRRPNGGFQIVWEQDNPTTSSEEVYFRAHYGDGGISAILRVNTDTSGDQGEPHMTFISDDKFVITFKSDPDDDNEDEVWVAYSFAGPASGESSDDGLDSGAKAAIAVLFCSFFVFIVFFVIRKIFADLEDVRKQSEASFIRFEVD